MNSQEFLECRRQIDTAFGRISILEKGSGPAALFLHGLPLCGYQWREVIAQIGPRRRCIAPDLMGLGYSDVPSTQDVSFAAQAGMLSALLDALNIEKVDLVGNDTGGGIAQIFAATCPNRVRSLTLANCEVSDLWPNDLLNGFYQSVVAGAITEAMRAMLTNTEFGQQQLGVLVYEDPAVFSSQSIQLYLQPLLASDKRVAQFKQLADWATNRSQLIGVTDRLKASTIPAQVIWGDGDVVFDTDVSLSWLRRNLGGLEQITTIPRAKLFFPEEHPRKTASLISQFWTMLPEPA
ncbi:MAG: alpha/beta fold hydrolase [Panacagrimonas sp.]